MEEISRPDRVDRVLPREVLEEVHGSKNQGVPLVQHKQWKVLEVDNLESPQLVPRGNHYVSAAGSIIGDSVRAMYVIIADKRVTINENVLS